jgi:AbrB family looped-hinge helix DNA binding protein
MKKESASAVLRTKRQVTIPRNICDQLGISEGDILELTVDDSKLIAKPRRKIALDALRAIQDAFQKSGITEEELQEAGREARKRLIAEKYGDLFR